MGICFPSTPKTPSQTGPEHLPGSSLGLPASPKPAPPGAAPEHPTALLLQLPGHCSHHLTPHAPTAPIPSQSHQCHSTEHYKLTIHRQRQSRSRFGLALKGLGYVALGIIIFIRIKLAWMKMLSLLFKCPQPLLLACKSSLVTRDYGAALGSLGERRA